MRGQSVSNKFSIRYENDYKEFLDESFSIRDLVDKEEYLFGSSDDAVDAFLEEFPEYYEYLDIEMPNPFIEE